MKGNEKFSVCILFFKEEIDALLFFFFGKSETEVGIGQQSFVKVDEFLTTWLSLYERVHFWGRMTSKKGSKG